MACGQSGCGSGCYTGGDGCGDDGDGWKTEAAAVGVDGGDSGSLCYKCKAEGAVASLLCPGCFRTSLFGKFKLAVTSHSMFSPLDNVLVAFSGGPASRVVLQFVHEMQQKAQANFDASRDKSLRVFGVGVVFVDDSAIFETRENLSNAATEVESILSSVVPPKKELLVLSIEGVFSGNSEEQRAMLNDLLNIIDDTTGKEDFLEHLRMLSLQKFASENGYTRLVLGSCASNIACKVISATVKGQGYALPADVHYVDARWQIPVVFPLRDCLVQELSTLCHLDGLKTSPLANRCSSGINGLVSSFVTLMQKENASRQRTIVRTAEKLTPFSFNKVPETNGTFDDISLKRRKRLSNSKTGESISADVLCAICGGPLNASEIQKIQSTLPYCQTRSDMFAANCCHSCSFQILPGDLSSLEHFYSLLPEVMIERVKVSTECDHHKLREQIQEFLLSDEDEM